MKRTAGVCVLLAALNGCSMDGHHTCRSCGGGTGAQLPSVPGMIGAWGQPVPMVAPYSAVPPGEAAARAMLAQHVPLEMMQAQPGPKPWKNGGVVQAGARANPNAGSGVVQASASCPDGSCAPGGAPGMMTTAPGTPLGPIAQGHGGMFPPGAVAASGAIPPGMPSPFPPQRTSVQFVSPTGMKVSWYTTPPGAPAVTSPAEIRVPGRYNFLQGSVYRLKLSNIARLPGVDLYPTLQVYPCTPATATFLAHSSVPVVFTDEDFDQVASRNFVTKVIYLPAPPFQDIATVGIGEIVSTRLEPGADPIAEACRRGSILLVVRIGNIDLEAPNTPAMDAPPNGMGMPHGMPGDHGVMGNGPTALPSPLPPGSLVGPKDMTPPAADLAGPKDPTPPPSSPKVAAPSEPGPRITTLGQD
jgi:hypothetical protein